MKIVYRISDAGYNKVKPDYINNEKCLANAVNVFKDADWSIIADNISEETNDMIQKYKSRNHINYVSVGHGAGTFNLALDEASTYNNNEIVYLTENKFVQGEVVTFDESNISSTIQSITVSSSLNITNIFDLDKGQRDQFYDLSRIVRKANFAAPTRKLLIVFKKNLSN